MADYNPNDAETWPDSTIVVRGGIRGPEALQEEYEAEGSFSVQADPGAAFVELCRCLPWGKVRRTTLQRLRALRGRIIESHGPDNYHCDVVGIDGGTFDSLLEPAEDNPVPRAERTGRSEP